MPLRNSCKLMALNTIHMPMTSKDTSSAQAALDSRLLFPAAHHISTWISSSYLELNMFITELPWHTDGNFKQPWSHFLFFSFFISLIQIEIYNYLFLYDFSRIWLLPVTPTGCSLGAGLHFLFLDHCIDPLMCTLSLLLVLCSLSSVHEPEWCFKNVSWLILLLHSKPCNGFPPLKWKLNYLQNLSYKILRDLVPSFPLISSLTTLLLPPCAPAIVDSSALCGSYEKKVLQILQAHPVIEVWVFCIVWPLCIEHLPLRHPLVTF